MKKIRQTLIFLLCLILIFSGCSYKNGEDLATSIKNDGSIQSAVLTKMASVKPEDKRKLREQKIQRAKDKASRTPQSEETLETGYNYYEDIKVPFEKIGEEYYFPMTYEQFLRKLNEKNEEILKDPVIFYEKESLLKKDTITLLSDKDIMLTVHIDESTRKISGVDIIDMKNYGMDNLADFSLQATPVLMVLDPNMTFKYASMSVADLAIASSMSTKNNKGTSETTIGRTHYLMEIEPKSRNLSVYLLAKDIEE